MARRRDAVILAATDVCVDRDADRRSPRGESLADTGALNLKRVDDDALAMLMSPYCPRRGGEEEEEEEGEACETGSSLGRSSGVAAIG